MFSSELRRQKLIFVLGDAIALLTTFSVAIWLHDPSHSIANRFRESGAIIELVTACAVLAVWLMIFHWNDLYRMRNGGPRELAAILLACSEATLLTLVGFFLFHMSVARITVVLAWIGSIFLMAFGRTSVRTVIDRLYANPKIAVPLLIVGFNPVAIYICDQIFNELGPYEPVGFLDDVSIGQEHKGIPVLPLPRQFEELAARYPGAEIAIALPDSSRGYVERIVRLCEEARLDWWLVPWMLPSLSHGARIEQIGIIPLIGKRSKKIEGLNFVVKRAFDIGMASMLILLTFPLIAGAGLLIMVEDGFPVFFRQRRIGEAGESFEILKLRTMRTDCNDAVHRQFITNWIRQGSHFEGTSDSQTVKYKLTNDSRITRVGRVLRRFSVDELPQLINVLRGQMSLIGPRPGLPYEVDNYEKWHRRRLNAKPGITGLWQVSGRNDLSFDEMVRLDVRYIEDWSLLGDLKILARTVPALLRGSGV